MVTKKKKEEEKKDGPQVVTKIRLVEVIKKKHAHANYILTFMFNQ